MSFQNKDNIGNENFAGKKIGIMGGSFDPIHKGHLAIAFSAYEDYSLDEVWFIPAGHSPNKDETKMTSARMRAEMTALAIRDCPFFRLSTIEVDSSETSYTYLTLSKLKKQYPDTSFFFIMGADSLDYFEKWYHPEIICEMAAILVAVRDTLDREDILKKIKSIQTLFQAEIYPLSCRKFDISSHEIRAYFSEGNILCDMVPESVNQYILEHHLYQKFS